MTEPEFSQWPQSGPYRNLFRVHRHVWVDMMRVFPGLGTCSRRQDELPYDFLVLATGAGHDYFGNDA